MEKNKYSDLKACVFGSSLHSTNPILLKECFKLGELLAAKDILCVNGGGMYGAMGALNEGCKQAGGRIKGIIHRKFCVDFKEHPLIEDLTIVDGNDLTERKQALFDNGDFLLVLPGGTGTFDELWEAISCRSLRMKGLGHKPICLVNVDGFYDGFVQQMTRASKDGVLYQPLEFYFHSAPTAAEALDWCVRETRKELSESESLKGEARVQVRTEGGVKRGLGFDGFYVKELGLVSIGVVFGVVLSRWCWKSS